MSHEQLLSRNQVEFTEIVSVFQELDAMYQNNYSLYLDSKGWELFDMRVGRTILFFPFGQFKRFTDEMRKLKHNIINVGMANIRVNQMKQPTKAEIWSVKNLLKFYPMDDVFFFNINLQNYLNHGFKQKKQVVANHY